MHPRLLYLALASLLLSACSQDTTMTGSTAKPVKIEIAGASNDSHTDSFVGTLRAKQRSDLSFEAAGRMQSMLVDIGDKVRAGQVLAQLDEAPTRWRMTRAQAERDAAAATLLERQAWLQQQQSLARDKIISATALQAALASHQQAQSQLAASEAALASARRELSLTRITAPFSGEVVARLVQAHSDVTPGQVILQIESGKQMELLAQLPEQIASRLNLGATAQARDNELRFAVKLERLGKRSENGSLVPAVFSVSETPATLRSGSAVTLELAQNKTNSLSLPVSALVLGTQPKQAKVFVLQGDRLHSRVVSTDGQILAGGRLAVNGIQAGEKIVVAGTASLHEGQLAVAYPSQSFIAGELK